MNKVAFFTLGCKVNQNDTEAMMGLFRQRGYEIVDFSDKADVYIINTCTVTHLAERKSRQMVRRAAKSNHDAIIAVVGCLSQVKAQETLQIPDVDLVLGTQDREHIVEWVEKVQVEKQPLNGVCEFKETLSFESIAIDKHWDRTRVFLKIQEGCNQFCSYCIVPYTRGPVRSRKPEDILSEVEKIVAAGFKELVLTGIHLGTYGQDFKYGANLASVIRQISGVEKLERIRLGSIEPMDLTDELIEIIALKKKVCNHLHIPLQSGDDTILKQMNRPYKTDEYRQLINKLRKSIPNIAVSTDIIVGFPGEQEIHFENSYEFCKEMSFSRMHVFKYSKREGTPAAAFEGQITPQVKEKRSHQLIELGKQMMHDYHSRFEGHIVPLLVEQKKTDYEWEGLTEQYIRVLVAGNQINKGEIITVKLHKNMGEYMTGEIINRRE